jgi:OOP family OmpA-OmpF porin
MVLRYALLIALVCACTKGQGQGVVAPAPDPAPVSEPPTGPGDGDGVADDQDACADDPGPQGCRVLDGDEDGVVDGDDRCPEQPETRNSHQDEDGCPDEVPPRQDTLTGTIKGIYFEDGKATIKPRPHPVLERAIAIMREYPEMRVEISGHTDDRERDPEKLALRRAQAVHDYLVEQGVDAGRLALRAAAAGEPIGDNSTPEGQAKQRRVGFRILGAR